MKLTITIIFSVLVGLCYGQDSIEATKRKKLNFTFSIGLEYFQISNLNSKLETIGYQNTDPVFGSLGIGKSYWKKKIYSGVDFKLSTNIKSTATTAGLIQGYFNYMIIENDKISFAPGIDIGYQKLKSKHKRNNQSNNFDSLFLSSGNYVSLENSTVTGGISIITCIKRTPKKKKNYLDPNYYIRLGYKHGFSNRYWTADNSQLQNAPQDRASSFYIQTMIAF